MQTDLELVQACAAAMGWKLVAAGKHIGAYWTASHYTLDGKRISYACDYNPLRDKSQAMDLVIRFKIMLQPMWKSSNNAFVGWGAVHDGGNVCEDMDLLRAICECVAGMKGANG